MRITFLVLLLMVSCRLATQPDENPLIGTWTASNYIHCTALNDECSTDCEVLYGSLSEEVRTELRINIDVDTLTIMDCYILVTATASTCESEEIPVQWNADLNECIACLNLSAPLTNLDNNSLCYALRSDCPEDKVYCMSPVEFSDDNNTFYVNQINEGECTNENNGCHDDYGESECNELDGHEWSSAFCVSSTFHRQ